MVKRIIGLILTVCYLFSSVGVSAKSMYCLGELKSSTISYSGLTPKKADCKLSKRTARKCCTTKNELLKVKDQHTFSGTFELLAKLFPVLFNFNHADAPSCAGNYTTLQHEYSNAPPPVLHTPVYVLNCSFRI